MAENNEFFCAECAAKFKTQEELDGHNSDIHKKQMGGRQQTEQQPQKRTA